MRKLLTFILLLSLTFNIKAQADTPVKLCRHEIALGTGYVSITTAAYSNYYARNAVDGLRARHPITIPVSAHYFYRLNEKWAIGATAHYEQVAKMEFYFGLMPQVKWSWFNRKYVSLYSRVAAGVMYANLINADNRYWPDFQLSPFGVEAGWQHWKGFIDLGAGTQNFIQGGIMYKF